MSTNYAPSRRATNSPAGGPSECDVAAARFEEAKAITDALVIRLSRERSELVGAAEDARIGVERRVQVTRIELTDARAYEDRVFAMWEEERRMVVLRPAAGSRSVSQCREVLLSPLNPSERAQRPLVGGSSTTGRRSA